MFFNVLLKRFNFSIQISIKISSKFHNMILEPLRQRFLLHLYFTALTKYLIWQILDILAHFINRLLEWFEILGNSIWFNLNCAIKLISHCEKAVLQLVQLDLVRGKNLVLNAINLILDVLGSALKLFWEFFWGILKLVRDIFCQLILNKFLELIKICSHFCWELIEVLEFFFALLMLHF